MTLGAEVQKPEAETEAVQVERKRITPSGAGTFVTLGALAGVCSLVLIDHVFTGTREHGAAPFWTGALAGLGVVAGLASIWMAWAAWTVWHHRDAPDTYWGAAQERDRPKIRRAIIVSGTLAAVLAVGELLLADSFVAGAFGAGAASLLSFAWVTRGDGF